MQNTLQPILNKVGYLMKRGFLILSLFALHTTILEASEGDKVNSINRIDSLTMQLLRFDSKFENKINVFEQPITEELFYSKMKMLGSRFDFKYNADVARQIGFMTNPASTFMAKTLPNSVTYLPIFSEVLDKRKLPDEIKYLAVIESALNPNAVSWCGATGLWQFMPGTGRLMNLQINGEIDERKDIVKSTEKAFSYLESMYTLYGDWFMALAAYNCGPGNVNKAIARSGGKRDYWSVRKFLPRETQQYVPKFIAAVFVMNFVDLNSLFACEDKYYKIVPVELSKPMNLNLASALLDWEPGFISEYNAFYKMDFIPEFYNDKRLYLPYYAAMQFIEMEEFIYSVQDNLVFSNNYQSSKKLVYHKVHKGETLYRVASKYNVTVDDIIRWNKLKKKVVFAGQSLKIYKTVTPDVNVNFANQEYAYYVVLDEYETLGAICEKIGMCDFEKTIANNDIISECDLLSRGTVIKIYPKCQGL